MTDKAHWFTHPVTGELRLKHDGTQRHLNRSLAWRKVEEAQLAEHPDCAHCGQPATEAHIADGICTVSPPYVSERLESLCRACHDATDCTSPFVTTLDIFMSLE